MLQNSPLDAVGQLLMLCVFILLVAAGRTDFVIRREVHRVQPTGPEPPRFGQRGAYVLPVPVPRLIWRLHCRLLGIGSVMFALAAIAVLRSAKSGHDVAFGWLCVLSAVAISARLAFDWWRYVHRGRVRDAAGAATRRDATPPR